MNDLVNNTYVDVCASVSTIFPTSKCQYTCVINVERFASIFVISSAIPVPKGSHMSLLGTLVRILVTTVVFKAPFLGEVR